MKKLFLALGTFGTLALLGLVCAPQADAACYGSAGCGDSYYGGSYGDQYYGDS
jgi:hypothetical protein